MCLIAFAWSANDRYPLVVASNRDEFYARSSTPAAWSDDGHRLSGRDLRGGGTWMGVARDGRFSALTNHRDPRSTRPDAPSRGALPDRVLAPGVEPVAALRAIASEADRYNGFNLLAARWNGVDVGMWIVSAPGESGRARVETVAPGIHGLSNARLDSPWPKVVRAKDALAAALADDPAPDPLVDRLFALLADEAIAPDDALPSTGVPTDVERALSAAFIRMPGYGTRASTLLIVERDGRTTFVERRSEPDVAPDTRRFSFETRCVVSAARAT